VELSLVDGHERSVNALTVLLTSVTTIEDRRLKFKERHVTAISGLGV
jgi:hypothetical protein